MTYIEFGVRDVIAQILDEIRVSCQSPLDGEHSLTEDNIWLLHKDGRATIGILYDMKKPYFYKVFDLHHPNSIQDIKECIINLRQRIEEARKFR